MSPEDKSRRVPHIPDWARRERLSDQAWIGENLHIFEPAARKAFAEQGRGALVVDTTVRSTGQGNPFGYMPQATINEQGDEDVQRMVREYDPQREFVLVMLKPEDRVSTYRVQTQRRVNSTFEKRMSPN